jgi:hypothetical protein
MENKEQNTGINIDAYAVTNAYNDYLRLIKCNEDVGQQAIVSNAFIAGASWQSSQPINSGWVSVEDRLPEKNELVNIILKSGATTVGRMSSKFRHWLCFTIKGVVISEVTYWQNLPTPPKQ